MSAFIALRRSTVRSRSAPPLFLARFGFLSRGFVYVLVGGLALRVALLQRGRALGPTGAFSKMLESPGGQLPLWILAAGLLAFVLYRAAQCRKAKGLFPRVAYAVGAIGGLLVAYTAVRVALHFHAGGDVTTLREAASRLLSHDGGRVLLALGGAIAVVAGAVEAVRAALGKLPADFTGVILDRGSRTWMTVLARIGVLAHGAIVAVTGYSVLRAGLERNPSVLGGTAGALRTIRSAEHGPLLFTLVAAGLLAYGLSLFVLAISRPRR